MFVSCAMERAASDFDEGKGSEERKGKVGVM